MIPTTPDNQDGFLRNVREALGYSAAQGRRGAAEPFSCEADPDAVQRYEAERSRDRQSRVELLDRLIEQATPLNLKVIPVDDASMAASAIARLVSEREPEWGAKKCVAAWKHPLIESLNLPRILAEQNVPVFISDLEADIAKLADRTEEERRAQIRGQIVESFLGVTSADFCVAETATLVLKTRANQARAVSLVPSIHVAVIRLDQILSSLSELYATLKCDPDQRTEGLTNCMTFISGPSKTADIELVMVQGAHGPREVCIYVVTGDIPP